MEEWEEKMEVGGRCRGGISGDGVVGRGEVRWSVVGEKGGKDKSGWGGEGEENVYTRNLLIKI